MDRFNRPQAAPVDSSHPRANKAQLIEAIAQHRTERYGSPPVGPIWTVDRKLYEKAGIS